MKRLIVSCFGLGHLPIAPGTWGSLPPAIVFFLLRQFHVSPAMVSVIMAVMVLVGSVVCVKFAPASIAATGKSDPSEVVADEFAGQALTFIFVYTVTGPPLWATAAGGFLLFRFLDILKPWPIRWLEKLPKGWGVLADDLMAAVYAGIALMLCTRLWDIYNTVLS